MGKAKPPRELGVSARITLSSDVGWAQVVEVEPHLPDVLIVSAPDKNALRMFCAALGSELLETARAL